MTSTSTRDAAVVAPHQAAEAAALAAVEDVPTVQVEAQDVEEGQRVRSPRTGTWCTVVSIGMACSFDGSLPRTLLVLSDDAEVLADYDDRIEVAAAPGEDVPPTDVECLAICGEHGQPWRYIGIGRGIRCASPTNRCETDWTELAFSSDGALDTDDHGWLHVAA